MLKFLQEYAWLISLCTDLIVLIGAPLTIFNYIRSIKQERIERQYGTYDALDDKYIEFQMMCLEKPYLNVFDIDDELQTELTPLQKKEEIVAYSILISIFERAYIMYKTRGSNEGGQWEGWLANLEDYCRRENFVNAWRKNGWGWDLRLEKLVNELIEKNYKPQTANENKEINSTESA